MACSPLPLLYPSAEYYPKLLSVEQSHQVFARVRVQPAGSLGTGQGPAAVVLLAAVGDDRSTATSASGRLSRVDFSWHGIQALRRRNVR